MPQEEPNADVLTEEVRLAMGWNGGVSLAIWMGGAAVELDCARRAYGGVVDGDANGRIYAGLCGIFDRMLVIDIIAGASAGGINGALLAGVISRGRKLDEDFLRSKWLEIGDFSRLLQPATAWKPSSIMQGDLFHDEMQSAFRAVLGEPQDEAESEEAALGEASGIEPADVLLDVQATNVIGFQRRFVDAWGEPLRAKEFRAPLRFRSPSDYSWQALASAARASASFPAAFEPHPVEGDAAVRAGFAGQKRWAIDGGLLENAPIRPAIDLIPTRRAERPVKRFVCYVNAAPAVEESITEPPEQPALRAVLGYVINLPREGRFIDQLAAIEEASRRAVVASDTEAALLELDRPPLRAIAEKLLPTYRRQRALQSLEEIVVTPGRPPDTEKARAIFERIEADPDLPWIPRGLPTEEDASDWRWGFRTAQRVVYLELDLLRRAFNEGFADEGVFEQRKPIESALAELKRLADEFSATESTRVLTRELETTADLPAKLANLEEATEPSRKQIGIQLRIATKAFHEAVVGLKPGLPILSPERLFGQDAAKPFDDVAFSCFLERALCIELIRRSFASDREIDSAQKLAFAQLTPLAPTPVLTDRPFTAGRRGSAEDKLTGIRLGHFAAFYRRSWRVNDYMWGRLDAAVRIADLLVDPERARAVAMRPGRPAPAVALANLLLRSDDKESAQDHDRLVAEALADAVTAPSLPTPVNEAAADMSGDLAARLIRVVEADLALTDGGLFTRVVVARAAQYEALRRELSHLVRETETDKKLGSYTSPLELELDRSLWDALTYLRGLRKQRTSLPELLGRDLPDEGTSTLGLRTLSHAALVTASALPSIALPAARLAAPVRLPLLAVAGFSAAGLVKRVAVVLAFLASAGFVTARFVTAEATGNAPLGALMSISVLATWAAAVAVVALVAVPAWRAVRSEKPRRKATQALWALLLAATGGFVAVGFGFWDLGFAEGLTMSSADEPPRGISVAIVAVAVPLPLLLRRISTPRRFLTKTVERADVTGGLTALLAIVVSGLTAFWSFDPLRGAFADGGWHRAAVVLVASSVLVAPAYVLFGRYGKQS